jgi:hypothetical protein
MKHIAFLLLSLVLVSCKLSLSGGNYGEAKTISIAFFPNNAALVQPTLSQSFTEDLRNFFQTQSPLSLISKGGDLQIEGAITDYRVGPVGVSNQAASSNRLTITVNVKFSNSKDSTKDYDTSFSRFVDFSSTQNISSIEQELVSQVNQQLIQDIFNKALINW